MKILVVIPTLSYGGAERLLVTLLPKLKDKGIEVKVCTLSGPLDLAQELEKEGISVVNLKLKHRWSMFEALLKLHKEVKKFNPDIAWGHLYFGILYSRLISVMFPRLKVVSVLHYNISSDSVKKGLWYSFRNWIFDKSQRIDFSTVAVSNSVKIDYEKFFGWQTIEVVFNALDLQKIDNSIDDINRNSYRKMYDIPDDGFLIVLPGRLHESKGHKYLIKAVESMKKQYGLMPKVIIAGEGSYRNEIENMITKLELDSQFILTGNLQQTELFKIMKISDIIIIPSLFEAFGIAAIEAMYMQKPVIVTNIDGLNEITTNDMDTIHVPVKNSNAIGSALIKLIKDKKLVKRLSHNAKQTASKYDANLIVKQWIDIFESRKN